MLSKFHRKVWSSSLTRSSGSFWFFLFFFLFLLCFILSSSFSFPFLVFFSPPTAHVPAERKKKVLGASRWPKWPPSSKKASWAPRSLRAGISRKLPWKVCQFFRWKRVEQIHSPAFLRKGFRSTFTFLTCYSPLTRGPHLPQMWTLRTPGRGLLHIKKVSFFIRNLNLLSTSVTVDHLDKNIILHWRR
jgi:hypothetical protein